ncbi:MAG: ABC transporter permease [Blastocatellia bacterium]
METFWQDLRFGTRTLFKNFGFALVALLTLALGIGANTAIFSVVNAVLLRPLPYNESERLALLWSTNARENNPQQPSSYFDFNDFKQQNQSFSEIAAASPIWNFVLSGGAEPEQIQGQWVSANLFSMLGVAPQKGRAFLAEEDQPNGAPAVIISHNLWQRYFSGDPEIAGKTLRLDGNQVNIVGVMPAGFQFLERVELWVPAARNPIINRGRSIRLFSVVGRLKSDVTVQQANAEMATIAWRLEQQYPDTNSGVGARLVPLHEQVTGNARPALLLLLGAVGLMLLALIGVGIGLVATFALARLMTSLLSNLLFSVRATDPITFAGVAALLALVALFACYVPARRAAKVDPMVALRCE